MTTLCRPETSSPGREAAPTLARAGPGDYCSGGYLASVAHRRGLFPGEGDRDAVADSNGFATFLLYQAKLVIWKDLV